MPDIDEWSLLSNPQKESLEVPFIEKEIYRAVNDVGTDKSPGPDGFTMKFFKKSWNVLKEDSMHRSVQ